MNLSTTKCFVEYGYMVSQPNGTTDYDLVVDVNGSLKKVQVITHIRWISNRAHCIIQNKNFW